MTPQGFIFCMIVLCIAMLGFAFELASLASDMAALRQEVEAYRNFTIDVLVSP